MRARRIYLDNSATSFPKPEATYLAVDRYQREIGAPFGRGATSTALEVQRTLDRCRGAAARLFGARRPEHVLFTSSGTDSLNLALHGLLNDNDRVITTCWEHNSVLRPLRALQDERRIQAEILPDDGQCRVPLDRLRELLKVPTRLVVVNHASNVTGVVQQVEEIAAMAREAGALVLLDAAQTAGRLPVTLDGIGVDLIACPGHKGLLGPLGTGLLVLRESVVPLLRPVRQGGTGASSASDLPPAELPARFEPGNHNVPGLFGLDASLAWLEEKTPSPFDGETETMESRRHWIEAEESRLTVRLISGLKEIPGLTVIGGSLKLPRTATVSVIFEGIPAQVAAGLLDRHFGIETRAGLHCAPRAHQALATFDSGGTVRFSLGPFNTAGQIEETLEAAAQVAAAC